MTKYCFDVLDAKTHEWESLALFSDAFNARVLAEMGEVLWNHLEGAADLAVLDMETGEVLWNAADAQEYEDYEDYEPDYDECGFNPYMGCYDFDC